jgi:hypothetical protein
MKTLENFEVIKETEKASLLKAYVSELGDDYEFWLPKSKFEETDSGITIEDDIWNDKVEELKTPKEVPAGFIYVENFEEKENSVKLILSAALKKINLSPWLFVPKSLIIEQDELDTDDSEKFYFKIPIWYWEKATEKIIDEQLAFYNKDREEDLFQKSDFKLLSKFEEE